eukprot:COSAG01_NODE_67030_length_268_cov_0.633136_1_plen_62_part_10
MMIKERKGWGNLRCHSMTRTGAVAEVPLRFCSFAFRCVGHPTGQLEGLPIARARRSGMEGAF